MNKNITKIKDFVKVNLYLLKINNYQKNKNNYTNNGIIQQFYLP